MNLSSRSVILCVLCASVVLSSLATVNCFYEATLVRVIDGDTVVLNLHLGLDVWKRKLHARLVGIDTPELHPRRLAKDATPAQRQARARGIRRARKAKAALKKLLGVTTGSNTPKGKALRVRLHGKDRYGRALITLFAGKVNVNQWLVEHGHAQPWKEQK